MLIVRLINVIYEGIFQRDLSLAIVFLSASFILVCAGGVGFWKNSTGLYAAFGAIVFGGLTAWAFAINAPIKTCGGALGVLVAEFGVLYLLLFVFLRIKEKIALRKEKRKEIERKLQYTLPDRDNSYLRERLSTVLRAEENSEGEARFEAVRFLHARELLAKVKEAPLTRAERLETDEISNLIGLYLQKPRFSFEDVRVVNDTFSRLLKLSAKYSV